MITVTASASCSRCDWAAGPSADWQAIDKSAERHTKAERHPTMTSARPATITTGGQRP